MVSWRIYVRKDVVVVELGYICKSLNTHSPDPDRLMSYNSN